MSSPREATKSSETRYESRVRVEESRVCSSMIGVSPIERLVDRGVQQRKKMLKEQQLANMDD